MIYELPSIAQPIRQGDIFFPVPILTVDLDNIAKVDEDNHTRTNWMEIKDSGDSVIQSMIIPSYGIVASQDCDASRQPFITLFRIDTFENTTRLTPPTRPKKWVNLLTQRARLNAHWFYLPQDAEIGFQSRMAINFHVAFQVPRANLERNIRDLRIGRLNDVAYQHYRESIAYYFRRFPYDEWYSLNEEEFSEYNSKKGPVTPFEWQK